MSSLIEVYTANGGIDLERWYTNLFEEVPCKYTFSVEDESKQLDIESITFDRCKHLFNNVLTVRQLTEEIVEESDVEELEFTEGSFPLEVADFINNSLGYTLTVVADHEVIFINFSKCVVYYSYADNLDEIKKLVQALWDCFPKEKVQEKLARVGLIKYSQGEYYTSFSDIKKTHINIEENYNDDFIPVYNDITAFLNQRESGLILLYGKAGSGNFYRNNLEN